MHSKNKPFKCDVCEYGAVRKQGLQKHMFRHKKIKLFKCKNCDYRGATRGDLKDHLKRNTKKTGTRRKLERMENTNIQQSCKALLRNIKNN